MSTEFQRVQSLFLAALEKPVGDWDEFIDRACDGDRLLQEQVLMLLKAHASGSGILDRETAPAKVYPRQAKELVGQEIGPYKLRERIAEGGMGVVYVAEQTKPVRRKVALKVIKPGMDTQQVVTRFEAERQALALMEHPNIATVLDAGSTQSGHPYFVMDLVRGLPITEHCDEHRLNTRERLELFVSICGAVQHAHQKGIIHRDIKPSNVLVTMHGDTAVPKVIDFGVAKAINQRLTERTVYTQFMQMVGTPLYMSPEQAEQSGLDVDTRSDVYSLGVLLYELLTGTTPIAKESLSTASYDELRRMIREDEAPRPSHRITTLADKMTTVCHQRRCEPAKLVQLVQGELDWIVMKSLEKDRCRRYDSVNALAADVVRYVKDEPVAACPPSPRYRMQKFARRHKTMLATTSLVILSLLVGIIGTGWQAWQATIERNEKEDALVTASQQRQLAEQNFQLALDAVDEMLMEVANEDLAEIPRVEPVRRSLLEKGLQFYDNLLAQRGNDPELRVGTGQAHLRSGDLLMRLHRHTEAERAYRSAIGVFSSLAKANNDDGPIRHGLARGYQELGDVLSTLGRNEEAADAYQQAVSLAEVLVADFPDDTSHASLFATSLSQLASLQLRHGDFKQATSLYEQGLAVIPLGADDAHYGLSAKETLRGVAARLDSYSGKYERPEQIYRESVTQWERLVEQFPDKAEYKVKMSDALEGLGLALKAQGKSSSALEILRKAVQINRTLLRDDPTLPDYRFMLAKSLGNLANTHPEGSPDAIDLCSKALQIIRKLKEEYPNVPSYSRALAVCLHNLGNNIRYRGDGPKAREYLREAIALRKELATRFPKVPDHVAGVAVSELVLGYTFRGEDPHQAETAFRAAVKKYRGLVAKYPQNARYRKSEAFCLGWVGQSLRLQGRHGEAADVFRECLLLYQRLIVESPEIAEFRDWQKNFGHCLAGVVRMQSPDEALNTYQWAVQEEVAFVRKSPAANLNPALPHLLRATASRLADNPATMEAFFHEQLALFSELLNSCQDQSLCRAQLTVLHHTFGHWLESVERHREAADQFRQAGDLLAAVDRSHFPDQFEAYFISPTTPNQVNSRSNCNICETLLKWAREEVEADPTNNALWKAWGRAAFAHYSRRGWKGAVREARRAIEFAAGDSDLMFFLAPLLLLAERETEYRQLCIRLLDEIEESGSLTYWQGVVRMCSLDPSCVGDPDRVLALAEAGIREAARSPLVKLVNLYTLGRAQYRAGNYEAAVELLTQAISEQKDQRECIVAFDLALAHHYWGRPEVAREWLHYARDLRRQVTQGHSLAQVTVLQREAESLIGVPEPTERPQELKISQQQRSLPSAIEPFQVTKSGR